MSARDAACRCEGNCRRREREGEREREREREGESCAPKLGVVISSIAMG